MWGKELNGKEAEAAVPAIGLPHATNVAEGHQNGTTESSNSAVVAGTQNLPLSADKDIGNLGIKRETGGGMYHGGRRNQGNLGKNAGIRAPRSVVRWRLTSVGARGIFTICVSALRWMRLEAMIDVAQHDG